MSEHIVHIGIVEDSFAIAPFLSSISQDFAEAMQRHIGFARLGSITVSGDSFSFRLLEEYRPLWQNRDDLLEAKLAFVLGWVSHRACDRQMKPIWNIAEMMSRGSDANPTLSPTECSVYHEAALYNHYFKDDPLFRLAIFPDELTSYPCAELFDLDLATSYVESTLCVNLMNIQTITPLGDSQKFIEEVCLRTQKFYVDTSRYTNAAGTPDPELQKNFVTDINWYDGNDEIIRVAVKLRQGLTSSTTTAECEDAMNSPASSHYGQALQLSLKYMIAASAYFADDSMPMDELKDRLDIGKKGRLGMGV